MGFETGSAVLSVGTDGDLDAGVAGGFYIGNTVTNQQGVDCIISAISVTADDFFYTFGGWFEVDDIVAGDGELVTNQIFAKNGMTK